MTDATQSQTEATEDYLHRQEAMMLRVLAKLAEVFPAPALPTKLERVRREIHFTAIVLEALPKCPPELGKLDYSFQVYGERLLRLLADEHALSSAGEGKGAP